MVTIVPPVWVGIGVSVVVGCVWAGLGSLGFEERREGRKVCRVWKCERRFALIVFW